MSITHSGGVHFDEITFNVDLTKPSQFLGTSVEHGKPVSYPLNNLEELFAWCPNDSKDKGQSFSIATVPFNPKTTEKGATKILLCHDMKGGYVEDRFVQGVQGKEATGYYVTAWNAIDVFVYFSHHFVTVPPVGWINACHRNGVAVLGTFIMEGDEGYKRCRQIFSSAGSWKMVANQIVALAEFYRFDGWLLNIENKVDVENIFSLVEFIRYLTAKMHQARQHSLVIWYDSVTIDGNLQWQNELNEGNRLFYESCDGIFLNYGWNENNLKTSKANKTSGNVFVGIDVFGRGCYGGGGYNSAAALSVIQRSQLSTAVFAPGWVYEVCGAKDFAKNAERFWKSLSPLTSPRAFGGVDGLSTRFNPGCARDWYHLSSQELMPVLPCEYFSVGAQNFGTDCHLNVYPCGENPQFRKFDMVGPEAGSFEFLFLLFKTNIYAPDGKVSIYVKACKANLQLVAKTNFGLCRFFPYNKSASKFQVEQMGKYIYISNEKPFLIEGIYLKPPTNFSSRIQCISVVPGFPNQFEAEKKVLVNPSPFTCEDVDWKRSGEDFFLLGCTLVFNNIPENRTSTEISYGFEAHCTAFSENHLKLKQSISTETVTFCQDNLLPSMLLLGRSYSWKYRVHDLKTPNPMYHGPNCFVIFVVRHLSRIGEVLAEGRLKARYAENI